MSSAHALVINALNDAIRASIVKSTNDLLDAISKDYGIDLDELRTKYMIGAAEPSKKSTTTTKTEKEKTPCIATTKKNKPCRRFAVDGSCHCKLHVRFIAEQQQPAKKSPEKKKKNTDDKKKASFVSPDNFKLRREFDAVFEEIFEEEITEDERSEVERGEVERSEDERGEAATEVGTQAEPEPEVDFEAEPEVDFDDEATEPEMDFEAEPEMDFDDEATEVDEPEIATEHSEDEAEHSEDEAEHSEDEAEHSEDEAEHSEDEAEHSEDEAERSEAEDEHSEAERVEDEAEHSEIEIKVKFWKDAASKRPSICRIMKFEKRPAFDRVLDRIALDSEAADFMDRGFAIMSGKNVVMDLTALIGDDAINVLARDDSDIEWRYLDDMPDIGLEAFLEKALLDCEQEEI